MTCTKTQYSTYETAMADVIRFQNESTRPVKPIGAYLCKKCGLHHITSKPTKQYVKALKTELFHLKQKVSDQQKEIDTLKGEPIVRTEGSKSLLKKENKKLKDENIGLILERNTLKKELDEIKERHLH